MPFLYCHSKEKFLAVEEMSRNDFLSFKRLSHANTFGKSSFSNCIPSTGNNCSLQNTQISANVTSLPTRKSLALKRKKEVSLQTCVFVQGTPQRDVSVTYQNIYYF